jgi:uracil-DNA glycosylase family 4
LKKSAADIREDLKAHVDFLTEAGAGFVIRRPKADAEPMTPAASAPSTAPSAGQDLAPLAVRRPQTEAERQELEAIDGRVRACTLCVLHTFRTNAVPGEGDRAAELMFIGEGPGRDEDLQGRPFVGRAGQLLRKIIAAMTFREDEVYITNMVKCRPPDNRVPHHEEMEACWPYLARQIELIRPRVIVTLGKTPTDHFVPGREGMTARRGRFGDYRGIPVMPTFHPSYLVRNEGNRELKRMVWEDMQKVMALLGRK